MSGLGQMRKNSIRALDVRFAPAGSTGHCNTARSLSAGVSNPKVFRGRWLSRRAILFRLAWEKCERSVPLGKYCRSKPLVFSLLPRCQGLRGSQKYTCTLVATVKFLWSAISLPRSQVKERRSSCGSLRTCLPSAATTLAVSLLGTLRSITKRVWRSTSVAMWVLFAPERRSPSQWPGTARSSASAGRSRMEAASTICPSPLFVVPPLAWRICRAVRSHQLLFQHTACLNKETAIDFLEAVQNPNGLERGTIRGNSNSPAGGPPQNPGRHASSRGVHHVRREVDEREAAQPQSLRG